MSEVWRRRQAAQTDADNFFSSLELMFLQLGCMCPACRDLKSAKPAFPSSNLEMSLNFFDGPKVHEEMDSKLEYLNFTNTYCFTPK